MTRSLKARQCSVCGSIFDDLIEIVMKYRNLSSTLEKRKVLHWNA